MTAPTEEGTVELPTLPEPALPAFYGEVFSTKPYYGEEQMTEFARAAVPYARGFLEGWRSAHVQGRGWSFIEADQHTETRFPGRPYCCGVLLDWRPSARMEAEAGV